jgi:ring-1,2-phenylacetyl-CoA epoxidase subunit PaaC
MIVKTPEDAKENQTYHNALMELLFQLADDDFIISYRGSEWLGLAPHIEEDVAFSSINQDTMGHAAIYYQLLEELGAGKADVLAHERQATERKNAIILELANGTGTYLDEPRFDWAFTVVRHFFYDVYKKIKLESLKNCSYEPLAQAAVKINMEQYYHVMHWNIWFQQLTLSDGEARIRMTEAIMKGWEDLAGLLTFGPAAKDILDNHLIESEEVLKNRFVSKVQTMFEKVNLTVPGTFGMNKGNGRAGQHTKDLSEALATLSEVYNIDPEAVW